MNGSSVAAVEPSGFRMFLRLKRSVPALVGLALVLASLALAFMAVFFLRFEPGAMNIRSMLQPPGGAHWLGTDDFGRDVWSRLVHGTRVSLTVGLLVTLLTTFTGVVLGLLAGYVRSLDNLIMRLLDMMMAFPDILLAIAVLAALGPRTENVVLALTVVYTPRSVRVIRASVIEVREREFVEGARAMGAGDLRVALRHILPQCVAPLTVQQTYIFAVAIVAEATLSFLGLGVPAGVSTLGNMLADGRDLLQVAPWLTIFPAIVLSCTVLGINLLGDGLRDAFDPRG